ncbi:MAG: sulfurtransferase-like selenium metabolism protein YedF [Oscillospiraceae bacterium]|nr:sulfurtransferase-like selenium metabolism protein YedF [Oscillospiraceae bacterium]
MKIIDVLGKPCPVPVIEAKKALAEREVNGVIIKVDNIVSVQNLEKMAVGYEYDFSYNELASNEFDVVICKTRDGSLSRQAGSKTGDNPHGGKGSLSYQAGSVRQRTVPCLIITKDTLGEGARELGEILIKGFIYSITELPEPPRFVAFLNSGINLVTAGANTIADLKKLEEKGTEIIVCGTCVKFYNRENDVAVGTIVNMYEITEKLASVSNVISI